VGSEPVWRPFWPGFILVCQELRSKYSVVTEWAARELFRRLAGASGRPIVDGDDHFGSVKAYPVCVLGVKRDARVRGLRRAVLFHALIESFEHYRSAWGTLSRSAGHPANGRPRTARGVSGRWPMTDQDADRPVVMHIERLVKEEHELYGQGKLSEGDRQRLRKLEVELDQCWDLLRQRRARREFGGDPDQARVRPPEIVENYER